MRYIIILTFVILLMGCESKLIDSSSLETIIIKQSGGSSMLIAECGDPEYIYAQADYIVEGVVDKTKTKWNKDKTRIFTYIDFSVHKYVKGDPLGDNIRIELAGGCIDDVCEAVEDQPILHEGERLRLYFHEVNGEFWIVCRIFGVEQLVITPLPSGVISPLPSENKITSFEECAKAGYPITESYPRQCRADGETFTEELSQEKTCVDNCGDGTCAEIVCMAIGCPCAETKETCPEDCS